MKKGPALALVALLLAAGFVFSADTYQVDPNHTTVQFSAKHLLVKEFFSSYKPLFIIFE